MVSDRNVDTISPKMNETSPRTPRENGKLVFPSFIPPLRPRHALQHQPGAKRRRAPPLIPDDLNGTDTIEIFGVTRATASLPIRAERIELESPSASFVKHSQDNIEYADNDMSAWTTALPLMPSTQDLLAGNKRDGQVIGLPLCISNKRARTQGLDNFDNLIV